MWSQTAHTIFRRGAARGTGGFFGFGGPFLAGFAGAAVPVAAALAASAAALAAIFWAKSPPLPATGFFAGSGGLAPGFATLSPLVIGRGGTAAGRGFAAPRAEPAFAGALRALPGGFRGMEPRF